MPLAKRAIGSDGPFRPRKATVLAPSASSQAAPWWARRLTSAKVRPSALRPSARRSGAASAIMSSRRAVCIGLGLVGGRQLLGVLLDERAAIEAERALATLAGQHHEAALLVGVALAQRHAAGLVGRKRHPRRLLGGVRHHRSPATGELAAGLRRANDHELRIADRALPARPGLQVHHA